MALAPTLVIAVGGSGFQTLCYLKAELRRKLANYGWHGELPKAWQFVAIDVQPTAIGSLGTDFADRFEQAYGESAFGEITYINLVNRGTYYDHIVQLLQNRMTQECFINQMSGWLPRETVVPIEMGSGQLSSLGRAIVLSSLDRLAQELKALVGEMLSTQSCAALQRVNSLIDASSRGMNSQPVGVVLSSIAGGLGSTSFLDVEKLISDYVPGGLYSFLHSPSVFRLDMPRDFLRMSNWNALSALSAISKDFESNDAWGEVSKFFGVSTPTNKQRCRFVVEISNDNVALNTNRFEIFKETAAFVAQLISDSNFAQEAQRWNLNTSYTSTLISPIDKRTDPLVIDGRRHGGFQNHSKLVPVQRALGITSFQACLSSGTLSPSINPFDSNVFHLTLREISEEYLRSPHEEATFRHYVRHSRTRPLIDSIPLSTTKLNSLIKGWTLARFFDEIRFDLDPSGNLKCSVLANVFAKDQERWTDFQVPIFRNYDQDYDGDTGLIATIKSLGLALCIRSTKDFDTMDIDNPLLPYKILIDLGELKHEELPGLIQARDEKDGSKKDIYALKEYLERLEKNLEESISTESKRISGNLMERPTGRYELRNLLHKALDDLVESVDRHIQEISKDARSV